jgi:hypothetical protein
MSIKGRPFRVTYLARIRKVGRICACGSVEGVVRSAALRLFTHRADTARIYLDGELFAIMRNRDNVVKLEVV